MAWPLVVVTDLCLILALLTASSCVGREFIVTVGHDGFWRTYPDEAPYGDLKVDDTLMFVLQRSVEAALLVSKGDYAACNNTQPFLRLDYESPFVLSDEGYYHFISTDAGLCRDGHHRLLIRAIRHIRSNTPSPVPPPPPKLALPSPSSTTTPKSSVAPSPPSPSKGNIITPFSSRAPPPSTTMPVGTNNKTYPLPSQSQSSSAKAMMTSGVLACLVVGVTLTMA